MTLVITEVSEVILEGNKATRSPSAAINPGRHEVHPVLDGQLLLHDIRLVDTLLGERQMLGEETSGLRVGEVLPFLANVISYVGLKAYLREAFQKHRENRKTLP